MATGGLAGEPQESWTVVTINLIVRDRATCNAKEQICETSSHTTPEQDLKRCSGVFWLQKWEREIEWHVGRNRNRNVCWGNP